jgi:hypothetical protein
MTKRVTLRPKSGESHLIASVFGAAARLLICQGRPQQANALLTELDHVAGIRADPYYASVLPEVVRSALASAIGSWPLAS